MSWLAHVRWQNAQGMTMSNVHFDVDTHFPSMVHDGQMIDEMNWFMIMMLFSYQIIYICGAYIFIIKTITRLCTLHLFESPFTSWSPGQRKGYGSSPYCRMEENGAQLLGDFTKPNDLVESLTFLDLKLWGLWYHDMPRILLVLVDNSYHDKAKGWIYKFSIGDICIDRGLPWIYMIDIYMSLECKICIYTVYIYTRMIWCEIFFIFRLQMLPQFPTQTYELSAEVPTSGLLVRWVASSKKMGGWVMGGQ